MDLAKIFGNITGVRVNRKFEGAMWSNLYWKAIVFGGAILIEEYVKTRESGELFLPANISSSE
jgi:hypothetical protein